MIKTYLKNIIIPVLVGGIVGLLIKNNIDYNFLNKPPLSPPGYIFPIVWTILYILMGVSYSILEVNNKLDSKTSKIYYGGLVVNALWSIFFFLLKWRGFAFIWIIFLTFLIIIMLINYAKKNKIAFYLQIPYLLWTLFASYLNLFISILN